MKKSLDEPFYEFLTTGLISNKDSFGINSFSQEDIKQDGFSEFLNDAGFYTYEKILPIYQGRQTLNLTFFFEKDNPNYRHIGFYAHLRLFRFMQKYLRFIAAKSIKLTLSMFRAPDFPGNYAIKIGDFTIIKVNSSGSGTGAKKNFYIYNIESINPNFISPEASQITKNFLDSQYELITSIKSDEPPKEIKYFCQPS